MSEADDRSPRELVSAVIADLSDLVRKESELVRSELSEKISSVQKAAMGMSAGAVLLLGAFLCILAAVVIGLSNLMPPASAALVVGVVSGLIGFTLVRTAAKKAEPTELAPTRLAQQVRRDAEMIKEQMR
jgi:VIT1/CCC1 family predicted Fe2+/Mn2+ transporter